jgi:hypothetical protein
MVADLILKNDAAGTAAKQLLGGAGLSEAAI